MKISIFIKLFLVLTLILSIGYFAGIHFQRENNNETDPEELKSLPYLAWSPHQVKDKSNKNVTKYLRNQTYQGLTLYTSWHNAKAHLLSMSGKILHSWSLLTDLPPFFVPPLKLEFMFKQTVGA